MKVMIVEDHTSMRRILNAIVSISFTESVDVIECENAEEGVEQYMATKPDCILMDFELPNMNGLEATKKILEKDSNAKIIFVTSYDSPSFRQKVESLPVLGLISKDNLSEVIPILSSLSSQTNTL
ncbi:MAG: response regulator transcription factor [Balneola sp.]